MGRNSRETQIKSKSGQWEINFGAQKPEVRCFALTSAVCMPDAKYVAEAIFV